MPSHQPSAIQQAVLTVPQRLVGATLGAGFIAVIQRLILLIPTGDAPSPEELGAHPWLAAAISAVIFFLLVVTVLSNKPAATRSSLGRLVDRTAGTGFVIWLGGSRSAPVAHLPLAMALDLAVALALASLWWGAEAFYAWLYPPHRPA